MIGERPGNAPEPRGRPAEPDGLARTLERAESELASLSIEILERYEEATLIYRLAERLGSTLGERAICRLVLGEVATVLQARSGSIWLRDGGTMVRVAGHPDPGSGGPQGIDDDLAQAMDERRPVCRDASPGSPPLLSVPLPGAAADPLGVIQLRGRTDGRSYRSGEVKLLAALASLVSAFVRNDRMATAVRREEVRRREDEIARQVHRGLLPAVEPEFPGLEVAGRCRAASHIGGDYYGYIPMADGGLGLAVADISGHGVGAALYMAAAKGAFQAEALRAGSPAEMLTRTNEALIGDFSRSNLFATAIFVRIGRHDRRMQFANAGHNPALLVRADGRAEWLGRTGVALGLVDGTRYRQQTRELQAGDLLLLYTDGLIEARNGSHEFYGGERLVGLARACRDGSATAVRDRVFADLSCHCGDERPHDDVTLVAVRVTGPGDAGTQEA